MYGKSSLSFAEREKKTLEFWKKNATFEKSLENTKDQKKFTFYDGPPFATGLPHYGHILAGTIKDIIPRYKTMKGYYVSRRFGWDCHGLPVENEIEKQQGLSGAATIEEFGIGAFNESCRDIVLRYTEEWKHTVERMGRWVDFSSPYKTMDVEYMESVWWVFSNLWDKDMVYKGYKVMPFSPKLGTPLSNFEANLNYKDVDDPSLTVEFTIDGDDASLLVWTTTPWTLISNLALAMSETVNYVKVEVNATHKRYYLAKARVSSYFKEEDITIISEHTGSQFEGKKYTPLFSYFEEKKSTGAFQILLADFATDEDGTGIVHMAPAFGEVDFYACQDKGIELVCPVDQNGQFTAEISEYEGMFVKDCDKDIIKRLKSESKVFHHTQINHRYPFCWRSDMPLIYKAVHTWFVNVECIKDKIIANNQEIEWVPSHIKNGRFGKWLENARDWAISRNRYWGTPMPIWESSDGDFLVIDSKETLEKYSGKTIDDIHRHFIDDIEIIKNGKVYKRVEEVFDCWFESGSMPYAQNHFPFEGNENIPEGFPADFIAEGLDQTRGWFYTLLVLSTALFDKPAFKNVIVNGILLAEDGNKMSKKLKNYPDPLDVVNECGADSIRLYMLSSPAVAGDDLRFTKNGVETTLRQFLLPLWNSYNFFATYAQLIEFVPTSPPKNPENIIDAWILSKLQSLTLQVTDALDRYTLNSAITPLLQFIEDLTNWYIRRSRSRFWQIEHSTGRDEAFQTLYYVLVEIAKIAAPFVPFITESIYQELRQNGSEESVHLTSYPEYNSSIRDIELEEEMDLVQKVVSLGRSLRKEEKIKLRQPLRTVYIASKNASIERALNRHKDLLRDELNVHNVEYIENESEFVSISVKPNFKKLGAQYKTMMRGIQQELKQLSLESINLLYTGVPITIKVENTPITLETSDVEFKRDVKEGVSAISLNDITLCYDTVITHDLMIEGYARELINKINLERKTQDFKIENTLHLSISGPECIKEVISLHEHYIKREVLAHTIVFHDELENGTHLDINGINVCVSLSLTTRD